MKTFNINDYVWVKLTDSGRRIHLEMHHATEELYRQTLPYTAPVEDAQGRSRWQLHELMSYYGSFLLPGLGDQPFATTIELEEV